MAKPKVFVSSTCYDLAEVRDSLCSFIRNFGFDPILSENGDVFYHPDLHTHDACIAEVSNCQMFVLIIGGRFGGRYVSDKNKSITNAEYEAAVKANIPIFTYIKKNVLENHHMYHENREKPFINEVSFPAIDKQEDAINIFHFINQVRKKSYNNAFEGFDLASDIENHIRKQWAGMFFDFLKTREINQQITHTSRSVDSLVTASEKLEDLIKSLYLSVDHKNASSEIDSITSKHLARTLLDSYIKKFYPGYVKANTMKELETLAKIEPKTLKWHEYIYEISYLEIGQDDHAKVSYDVPDEFHLFNSDEYYGERCVGMSIYDNNEHQMEMEQVYLNGICKLNEAARLEILKEFSILKSLI